jgi:Uma2 family endonuclease
LPVVHAAGAKRNGKLAARAGETILSAMSVFRKPVSMISAGEFLHRERLAESRSDFVNGEVVPVRDGNMVHAEIGGNILVSLHSQLRGRPGRVCSGAMKVHISRANAFLYPDVSGLGGLVLSYDKHHDAYCNPAVIFEVLSPSTEAYDRGLKFTLYRMLDSLFEYVLVSQDRMEAEVWTRGGEGVWTSVVYNEPADSFALRTLNCTLTLAEIYERVEFGAAS